MELDKAVAVYSDEDATPVNEVVHKDTAYAVLFEDTTPWQMQRVHTMLDYYGFELMDPEECPPEPTNGKGLRYWAARLPTPLPLHRTEAAWAGYRCSTCDGGGCLDCTDGA